MTPPGPRLNNTLDAALNNLGVDDELKDRLLRVLHGLVTHCQQRAALDRTLSDTDLVAQTRCYGSMIEEIEGKIGANYSPMAPKSTRYVPAIPTR